MGHPKCWEESTRNKLSFAEYMPAVIFSYSYRHIVSVRPLFKKKEEEAVCLRQKEEVNPFFGVENGQLYYTSLYVCVHVPVIETYQYYNYIQLLLFLCICGSGGGSRQNEG